MKFVNVILNVMAVVFLTYGAVNILNDFFIRHVAISMIDGMFVGLAMAKFLFLRFRED